MPVCVWPLWDFLSSMYATNVQLCMRVELHAALLIHMTVFLKILFWNGSRSGLIRKCFVCFCCSLFCVFVLFLTYIKKMLNIVWLLHTFKRSCTTWYVWLWCVFKEYNSSVFGQSSVWTCRKLEHWDFLRQHECDQPRTLHNGAIDWASPVHTTFIDRDHISRSPQCQTLGTEKLMFIYN